jgi:HTH-type transcriptional regulator / antitoxin HigA
MRVCEINSGEDLEKALARLDEIWSVKPGDADWEERRALVERITAYEDATVHIPPPDPVEAILFRMEQGGLKAKDLVPFIGSASKVSEVLSRKRGLSKEMICRLHEGLGIPLASLLGVEPEIPEGFVQVDLVLPTDVVANVTAAAGAAGISISDMVARLLKVEVVAAKDVLPVQPDSHSAS